MPYLARVFLLLKVDNILTEYYTVRLHRQIRQIIEGKKSAQRAVPEATPDELNE